MINQWFSKFIAISLFLWGHAFFPSLEGHPNKSWAPDCLIIGTQKGGTSALIRFLGTHDLIPTPKGELDFFSLHFENGTRWYQKNWRKRGELYIEKSPSYMFYPEVPERVYNTYPNVKIIVILRNPTERAYSSYRMAIRNQWEHLSFREALDIEEERAANGGAWLERRTNYRARGVYVNQLKRWFSYFPREQFLCITFEDLRDFPEKTTAEVLRFLGVRDQKIPFAIRSSKYSDIDPEIRAELDRFYRPYNEELEQLLGRKFNWN